MSDKPDANGWYDIKCVPRDGTPITLAAQIVSTANNTKTTFWECPTLYLDEEGELRTTDGFSDYYSELELKDFTHWRYPFPPPDDSVNPINH